MINRENLGFGEAGNSTHEIGRVGISGPVCLDTDSCLDSTRQKLSLRPVQTVMIVDDS